VALRTLSSVIEGLLDSAIGRTVRSTGTLDAPMPVRAQDTTMQAATNKNSGESKENGLATELIFIASPPECYEGRFTSRVSSSVSNDAALGVVFWRTPIAFKLP